MLFIVYKKSAEFTILLVCIGMNIFGILLCVLVGRRSVRRSKDE
jgi:hypothetical protein